MSAIDVVIITTRRKSLLEECLQSVLGWRNVRVIVVVNGYDRDTVELLERRARDTDNLSYTVIEKKVPKSRARNTGLAMATAAIVYFLDDDTRAAGDNAAVLRKKFAQNPAVAAVGGPNITPASSSRFQRVAGYALSSLLVAWKMRQRYIATDGDHFSDDRSLMLCNLALRRDILEKEGIAFDERLEYNEENLLLQRLRHHGHSLLYTPELVVSHERRCTLFSYARQVFKSGEGRAVMTLILPDSFSAAYAVPSLFVAYLLGFAVIRSPLYALPLAVYAVISLLNALYIMVRHRECPCTLFLLLLMPLVSHLAYGIGFIRGFGRMARWKH